MRPYKDHTILKGSKIKDALLKLDLLARDAILFVVDEHEKLIGSLTDGDVRRGLLKGVSINNDVDEIIQPNPKVIKKGDRDIAKIIEYREGNYKVLPVINYDGKLINIINFRHLKSYLPLDAVIMAGGRGERLRPFTDTIPKPLLKIGEKAIMEYNLDRLALYGIDDFWVSVKYLGEQVITFFGNGDERNIRIEYIREDEPLGTIGSVSLIDNFIHDYVLVTNSDILTNLDYEDFFLHFIHHDADMAIVTIPYHVSVPYAVLETNNGHIIDFQEKPTYTYYSNGGIYLIKKSMLSIIPSGARFDATDLMEKLIANKKKVISYPMVGYWLDIGKHEDFAKAQDDIKHIKF
jgi:dTDP-glucose pyrophosphorylase